MIRRSHTRRTAVAAICTAGLLLTAACSATVAADKTGSDTVVLHLGSVDAINNNGYSFGPQAFIDTLASVSGGRVTAQVEESSDDRSAEVESNVVMDIAAGKLDGGWPASRAFAAAGISGLEAVEAPMTITSYAAERDLVTGPVADALMAQLHGSGVVGLGLLVGPLRRPFAAQKPLISPADWQGASFRVFNSPVQAEVVAALGGTPVNVSLPWLDEVVAGRLRGAEFDIIQYANNGLTTEAGQVTTDVVLWPKVPVLSLSQQRYDSLTGQQQQWVREAAEKAVQATVDTNYNENALAQQLCLKGVHFYRAGPDQTRALQAKVRPVLDRLAADSTSGPLLKDIQAIAANHPTPDVPTVPATCTDASGDALGPVPNEVSALPSGLYRVEITRDEVTAAGFQNNAGHPAGTWTLTVRDGTYELRCKPLANPNDDCGTAVTDLPVEVGDLKGTGKTVYFVGNLDRMQQITGCLLPPSGTLPGHCGFPDPYWMDWSAEGDSMTFTGYAGASGDIAVYSIKPWQKIG